MVIESILYIGLCVTPFVLASGFGGRYPQEIIALGVAAAIGLYSLNKGILRPFSNKWLLLTVFFMIMATSQVPPSGMGIGFPHDGTFVMQERQDMDNLWNYKPILFALIYLLMVVSISSIKIMDMTKIFRCMAWSGGIMAIIGIFQYLGFQQYWHIKTEDLIGKVQHKEIIGFIGQPTLLAAYLATCLLPAMAVKGCRLLVIPMIVTIFLTGSAFGKLAIIAAVILGLTCGRRWTFLLGIGVSCVAAYFIAFVFKVTDHGRFSIWQQIIFDLTHPLFNQTNGNQYGFTGYGAGAFHFAYPIMHNLRWGQAHNEFLEFLFNNGVIGLSLFVAAIGMFFMDCWKHFNDPGIKALVCMFLVTMVIACGTFIWQLAFGALYTSTFIGLAYNRIRTIENKET